jgi:hypothetical protein
VAQHERNFLRKIQTQGNCGLQKELGTDSRRKHTGQKWHGTWDTIARDMTRTVWYKKRGKDGRLGRDVGRAQNATMT